MNKTVFNLFAAGIIGIIAGVAMSLAGNNIPASLTTGLLSAAFAYTLLIPSVFSRVRHVCCDLDWADEAAALYNRIPPVYRKSFWLLFGFINLAFLFHTVNFMWGADDWAAVRSAVNIEESLQNGRFSAYWLQELLFDGKILPVANNLWAFLGLSLAGVLLAIYWNLPQKTATIVVLGLFFAVTPYTLSWMYSAKYALGILWLPAISLAALLLADVKTGSVNRIYAYNLISVLLFVFALGTNVSALNFIAIAILGRVFIKTVYADIGLKDACLRVRQSVVNLAAAIMMYILIEFLLNEAGSLQTPHSQMPQFIACWFKIPALFKAVLAQFVLPLPFADVAYKLLLLFIVLSTLFVIIFKAPNAKAATRGLVLTPFLLIASKLSFLFTMEPLLSAETEFFSLPLFYTLMLSVVIKLGGAYLRRAAYILTALVVFMGFVRVAYAQKVWKFGWDAETKLAERIITRLEKMPDFNISRQYKLIQIGEMSLRPKYYIKKPYEKPSASLLEKPYYPAGSSKDAYNFYYQTDFLIADADEEAFRIPAIKDYLLNNARAWPEPESLWIYDNYIVMIIDESALEKLRKSLSEE